ncbi:hypothetical protein FA13DRAFT_1718546 [Coprinellus micaceus]|uniref:Uncharacterized protein n=1 Tax=Coprinellus micaceus TaxID=71717 RepID=A0A4Y7SE06_COPMI|nr:hypothetical protein FA13DRAFT_1718546 [Coprinellus micaceus]
MGDRKPRGRDGSNSTIVMGMTKEWGASNGSTSGSGDAEPESKYHFSERGSPFVLTMTIASSISSVFYLRPLPPISLHLRVAADSLDRTVQPNSSIAVWECRHKAPQPPTVWRLGRRPRYDVSEMA